MCGHVRVINKSSGGSCCGDLLKLTALRRSGAPCAWPGREDRAELERVMGAWAGVGHGVVRARSCIKLPLCTACREIEPASLSKRGHLCVEAFVSQKIVLSSLSSTSVRERASEG